MTERESKQRQQLLDTGASFLQIQLKPILPGTDVDLLVWLDGNIHDADCEFRITNNRAQQFKPFLDLQIRAVLVEEQ